MSDRPIKASQPVNKSCFVAAAVAVLASVACGEVAPEGSFTLSGTLTDSRKAELKIPGASVRLVSATTTTTTTDSLGRFRFVEVPGGKVSVTVGAVPGYRIPDPLELLADSDLTLDLGLTPAGTPPFAGTVWVTPDILGPDDPSSLDSVAYAGRGTREIFDRRANAWITVNAYLFDVRFGERIVEWQFNPEFGSEEAARAEIEVFAPAIGRLPAALLSNLQEVEVNAGQGAFGGNSYNGSILIHTEDSGTRMAVREGFLEEVFMHEAAHASLDPDHGDASGWRAAQQADIVSISSYARDFPDREDVAESILPYFAVRYRPGQLTATERWLMTMTTPHRWDYFDEQELDMSPYALQGSVLVVPMETATQPVEDGRRLETVGRIRSPAFAEGTGGAASRPRSRTSGPSASSRCSRKTTGPVGATDSSSRRSGTPIRPTERSAWMAMEGSGSGIIRSWPTGCGGGRFSNPTGRPWRS